MRETLALILGLAAMVSLVGFFRPRWILLPNRKTVAGVFVGLMVLALIVTPGTEISRERQAGENREYWEERMRQLREEGQAKGSDRQAKAPPSPETDLANLESTASSPENAVSALRQARALVKQHPGTPQAATAAAMIPELEARADSLKRIAEEEAEARRLARKWSYSSSTDEMTSRTTRTAAIVSENTINLDFPYEGEQHGTLLLRDHPSFGRDVIFRIEEGQLLCGSYSGCQVRVRFDEGQPQRWGAAGPSDNKTTVLFIHNYNRFLQRMRNAAVVRIQPEIYQAGAPVFEFHVGGFDPNRYAGNE